VISSGGMSASLFLLLPHEAIRNDLKKMNELLHPSTFGDPPPLWKVANFFCWYREYFKHNVQAHHDSEDQYLFPYLQTLARARGSSLPSSLTSDHQQLTTALAVIADMESRFSACRGGDTTAKTQLVQLTVELRTNVSKLGTTLRHHLAEEEQLVEQMLQTYVYSESAEKQQVFFHLLQTMAQSFGLDGLRKMVPWLVRSMEEVAGKDETQKVLEKTLMTSSFVKNVYENYWKTEDEARNVFLLESLRCSTKPTAPRQRCCCFCRYYEGTPSNPSNNQSNSMSTGSIPAPTAALKTRT